MASQEGHNMVLLIMNFKSMAHVPKPSIHKGRRYCGQFSEHYLPKHTKNIKISSQAVADCRNLRAFRNDRAPWEMYSMIRDGLMAL